MQLFLQNTCRHTEIPVIFYEKVLLFFFQIVSISKDGDVCRYSHVLQSRLSQNVLNYVYSRYCVKNRQTQYGSVISSR